MGARAVAASQERIGRRRVPLMGIGRAPLLAGIALAWVAAGSAANAQNIDTTTSWNGTDFINSWGVPNTATYGETITATAAQQKLTGFTFELNAQGGVVLPQYQAFVYQWNPATSRITGPALFTSAVATAPGGSAFVAVPTSTNGIIQLTPGQQYVLFFTTSTVAQPNSAGYKWGSVVNTAYPGGQFVFNNNGNNFGSLATTQWSFIASDLAFIALFGPLTLTPLLPPGAPTNPTNVAGGIDKIINAGGTVPLAIQNLSNLSPDQLVVALDLLSGEGISATQQSGFIANNQFVATLLDQATFWLTGDGSQPGGAPPAGGMMQYASADKPMHPVFKAMPSQPYAPRTWRVWSAAFGAGQSIDGEAAIGSASVSERTFGGVIGADYQVDPNLLVGIAAGGSDSTFRVQDRLTDGSLTGGHAGLYGVARWGAWYAAATATYAHFENKTDRIAGLGATESATGKFSSNEVSGRLELGWRQAYGGYNITPFAAVEVAQLWQSGFSETSVMSTGAPGVFGLAVDSRSVTSLPTFLGAQLDTNITINGIAWSPFLRAAWVHEFDPNRDITATFVSLPGSSFSVSGPRAARDSAKITAGSRFEVSPNVYLFATADGEFSDRSTSYSGTGGFKVRW